MARVRARNICFTAWCDNDTIQYDKECMKYLIIGVEVCPETGKKHLQGYVEFSKTMDFSKMKEVLGGAETHLEKRRGSAQQASDYCTKEGSFKSFGEISRQGKRNDIDEVKDIIKSGGNLREITESTSSFQGWRAAEMYLKHNENKRNWLPDVHWYYGETGSGKTKKAHDVLTDLYGGYWMSGKNLKWWEGYDADEGVLIDDFRKDFCTFHELLRILDRYEYRVEVKGGSRQLLAKTIIITSCYAPTEVYDTREDVGQLIRRIAKIVKI